MSKKEERSVLGLGGLSEPARHQMIKEYLESDQSKLAIWRKYTGQKNERGHLLRLMRKLGYVDTRSADMSSSDRDQTPAQAQDRTSPSVDLSSKPEDCHDRVLELEKLLEEALLKAEGFELMIHLAEKELGIPIQKKSATK